MQTIQERIDGIFADVEAKETQLENARDNATDARENRREDFDEFSTLLFSQLQEMVTDLVSRGHSAEVSRRGRGFGDEDQSGNPRLVFQFSRDASAMRLLVTVEFSGSNLLVTTERRRDAGSISTEVTRETRLNANVVRNVVLNKLRTFLLDTVSV